MIQATSFPLARHATLAATLLVLCACTTSPAQKGTLAPGTQATLEGEVNKVDTGPWAYDGNAVVTIVTASGMVAVQLPARWNLCKAPAPDNVQGLHPGDRVRVVGTVTAPGEVVVCAEPQHRLSKL